MSSDSFTQPATGAPGPHPVLLPDLVIQLQRLRQEAGSPSYATIAQRISTQRAVTGRSPEHARVARSTVYDLFRPDRRRLDTELLREVLRALGLGEDEVEGWVVVARRAKAIVPVPPNISTEPTDVADVETEPVVQTEQELETEPEVETVKIPAGPRSRQRLLALVLACVLVNLLGRSAAVFLDLPLYLDMVGTAVMAVLVGPWWAVVVGTVTNVAGVGISGTSSLPFTIVNVAGALAWGYGVHRFGMARSLPRFFVLNVLVAFLCTLIAAPILLFVFDGYTGHGSEQMTGTILDITHGLALAVFSSNLLTSLADKMVSGFVALTLYEVRRPARSSLSRQPRQRLSASSEA